MNNLDNNNENIELTKQKTKLKKSILVLLIVSIIGVIGVTLASGTIDKRSRVSVDTGTYNVIITGNTSLSPSGLRPINNTSDTISPSSLSNYASSIFISDFTVKGADGNPVDQGIIYDIALIDSNIDGNLLNSYLKWELIKNNEIISSGNFSNLTNGERYVLTDIQQDLPRYSQSADSLKLVIWINNNFSETFDQTTMMNKSFSATIDVELYTKSKVGWEKPKNLKFINRQNPNSITVGDELAIKTEHFYVVSSNSSETVLLAKYNLYVGDIYDIDSSRHYTLNKRIQKTDPGYGLQNENAKGWVPGTPNQHIGVVAFSGKTYWEVGGCGDLLPQYGLQEDEPWKNNNVYDNSYVEEPIYTYHSTEGYGLARSDNNYSIALYVEEYIQKLKDMGLTNVSGRLITINELENLGCDADNYTCRDAPEWIHTISYWLGTAEGWDCYAFWIIIPHNNFLAATDHNNADYGVRPVIVVPTSKIL